MTRVLNSDRARINFQDDVDSFPLDENFGAYQNRHNQLVDIVDGITSPVAGNEITNGTFDNSVGWTLGTGWTIAGGVATASASIGSTLYQDPPLVIGQTYTVTFTISNYSAGTVKIRLGLASGTLRSANGTYTEEITCSGSTEFIIQKDASGAFDIDDVVCNGMEISSARPYHPSLRARLDSMWASQPNYIKEGGAVTVNAIDTDKLDISAGEARVGGSDVKWNAQTTASATPSVASGKHRIDTIVINSDSTISQVIGSEVLTSINPPFPAVNNTELSIGVAYVDETGSVDLTGDLFNLD
ncbi:hypothetical protein OAP25_03510, partial [Flavobacteriaceae bacterium]|nr:hypothetical protein [Flavobacteriaceae bacterium]